MYTLSDNNYTQSADLINLKIKSYMKPPASDLVSSLRKTGLIPVFSHLEVDLLIKIVELSYRCGVRVFEFTHLRDNRGLRLFHYLAEQTAQYQDLILGVGTVLDVTMTERYLHAGAKFIASPFMRADMAEMCHKYERPWMPGCSAVPEILQARSLGAKIITVLPGNILGPEFIAPLTREYKDFHLVPSGGIETTPTSLKKWFEANALCVKLNSALFPKEAVAMRDWTKIESNLLTVLKTIRQVKASVSSVNSDLLAE
jgi:2-dehydro-3-deoxyphosphogluconate aldolase/(4S)-4-hydroxy-2-oxoglutarate aldolase